MYAGLGMRVPVNLRRRLWTEWTPGVVLVCGLVMLQAGAMRGEKKPVPWVRFPLEALGFPGVSNTFLGSGSSVLTVNFVDSSHLLVTYGLRKLVPRLEGDPDDDEDRLVAGEIVDLPYGHIEARTEWRMHDHGRYLWNLGGGRFLLRMGQRLYTMDPKSNREAKDPFARTLFPNRPQRPGLVEVSPDGGVVTLETVYALTEPGASTKVVLGDQDTPPIPKSKTMIDFFRIRADSTEGPAKGGSGFEVVAAGVVQSPMALHLPIDADGYLWAEEVGGGMWAVTFDGFGGKTIQLGAIKSSCRPMLQMTSRSEYLAMTCQGSDDRIKMISYGLDGSETWEEMVGDFGRPGFAFAPAAARFAVSGSDSSVGAPVSLVPGGDDSTPRQEVRVYQNASGDLLLRVSCNPVFKTTENFDLSPDGMLAAVIRDGAIAVYKLPPLSKRDRDDMAESATFAPPASTGEVMLKRLTGPPKAARRPSADAGSVGPGNVEAPLGAPVLAESGPVAPRKPPTLLNPGEKPVFGTGNAEPQ
jgi:hypothetical protein